MTISRLIFTLLLSSMVFQANAQWEVMSHTDIDTGQQTRVATIENQQGYKLEIYRDNNDVIRSRFNLRNSYDLLAEKHCPTFQVDSRTLSNRSINDAPCISQKRWAEYVIGYASEGKVLSLPLHNLMNGNIIYYRFLLENGGYSEAEFSLSGSKAILNEALGNDLVVITKSE